MNDDQVLLSKMTIVGAISDMVRFWAESRSKDPSTKVGACIYDPKGGGMFFGYNGFPKGIADSHNIWNNRNVKSMNFSKYDLVIHAEKNALKKALVSGVDISQCILVCTTIPCPRCMLEVVVDHGIKQVYFIDPIFNSFSDRDKWVVESLAKYNDIKLMRVVKE